MRAGLAGVFAAVLGACAAGQRVSEAPLRPLAEARALDVILEAFAQQHVAVEQHRTVTLRNGRPLVLDVALTGRNFAVEYFVDADRRALGPDVLRPRTSAEALLTFSSTGADAQNVEVLVLHDHEFAYEPDPDRTNDDRPSMIEVEDRLRRAVVDYLAHLRRQGQL